MPALIAVLLLFSGSLNGVHAAKYHLIKDYTAHGVSSFFDSFDFFTAQDPTNGFVQYLDQETARSSGVIGFTAPRSNFSTNPIYIGVGTDEIAIAPGRPSVRISSKASYSPGTLFVADIQHSPGGVCGVWPALWLLGSSAPWPAAGELDIFEQVSLSTQNSVTLHTGPDCALLSNGSGKSYQGSLATSDCYVDAPNQAPNAGCSVLAPPGSASFGAPFNDNGGGVYAAEWTAQHGFAVWFFARNAIPTSLLSRSGGAGIDTAAFGTPLARFDGKGCDWSSNFQEMQIIINTALCGDWAGKEWEYGGCAARTGVATCEEYVANDPTAFEAAYWQLGSLRVFGGN